MRKALGAGVALAAVAAHGMVSSAMDLSNIQPVWTYHGSFQRIVLWTWRLWTEAHGWRGSDDLAGLNHSIHVDDFARFYAESVFLVCPLLGFWAFSLAARLRTGWQWWKPMAVAVAFATPLGEVIRYPLLSAGLNEPLAEVARAIVVVILMARSAGAIRTLRWWRPGAAVQSAAA
jgi:hypothetical protein